MGPEIYRRTITILGAKKCLKCNFVLLLDLSSSKTPRNWNGIFLKITILETAECPFDIIIEKMTRFAGKEMEVRQSRNASVVFNVSLREPFTDGVDLNSEHIYFKEKRICWPEYAITKETYCSEIDIRLPEIVHLEDQNLKRNFRSLFNGSVSVENGARTLCLDTYFSAMTLQSGYGHQKHSVYSCIIGVIVFRLGILLMNDVHI